MSTTIPGRDETYARAAHLLARLAARRTPGTAAGASDLPARSGGPQGRGRHAVRCSPACWMMTPCGPGRWSATPSTRRYRADLSRALDRMPGLLARWTRCRARCRTATRPR